MSRCGIDGRAPLSVRKRVEENRTNESRYDHQNTTIEKITAYESVRLPYEFAARGAARVMLISSSIRPACLQKTADNTWTAMVYPHHMWAKSDLLHCLCLQCVDMRARAAHASAIAFFFFCRLSFHFSHVVLNAAARAAFKRDLPFPALPFSRDRAPRVQNV